MAANVSIMSKISRFSKANIANLTVSLILGLMCFSTTLSWYNRQEMLRTTAIKQDAEAVQKHMDSFFSFILMRMDLGLRGYVITQEEQLLAPYKNAIHDKKVSVAALDSLLRKYGQDSSVVALSVFSKDMDGYIAYSERMRFFAKQGDAATFRIMLKADKGLVLWKRFEPFYIKTQELTKTQIAAAQADYASAMNRNLIFQILTLLCAVPTLLLLLHGLRKASRSRRSLLADLTEKNRKYLFNPREENADLLDSLAIQNSIDNIRKASAFVKEMASGDYNANWEGLDETNQHLNRETLAGELTQMRGQLKQVREDDAKRNWASEGLARFSEIVRSNQDDSSKLTNEALAFLTKYLGAQQGGLFVLQESNGEQYLELSACYAFDRKKFVEKRIEIGSGLVGQIYLEGETTLLTEIPQSYIAITSGLGDATPACLVIVPMKHNEQVQVVLELASFNRFADYQTVFLEKAGDFMASAIVSGKVARRTEQLLAESQQQAEMLRAQEEEMRQNMEELAATQEALIREDHKTSEHRR